MYFKKIEMVGFKSFADKTVIEFNGGFTAIVGPNGCGKSNVSDAIRWVLGEQSAKSLRGDNMQDVIFKGTEKRKSLSYCEVSLTFDNTDRFFDFPYDELVITRKLYRSGESEYLINRNTCRLMDINSILFDSGIGKKGYSVIGQGKVSEIVDEKPEDRRAMFEEAAGIAKFKSRKTEAENKLAKTRDNLTRIDDICGEIDKQMGPLKKQAENAKLYLDYKGQLKDLEVNAYVFQYDNASTVKSQIGVKLKAISEEIQNRQDELSCATMEYNKQMEKLSAFDQENQEINEEILKLTVNLEKQEGETKIAREKINYTQRENDRLNSNVTNAKIFIENCTRALENKRKLIESANQKLETLKSSYEQLERANLELIDKVTASENEAGKSQQEFIQTLGNLSDIKSDVSSLATEKNILIDRQEKIVSSIKEAQNRKSVISSLIEDNTKRIAKCKTNLETTSELLKDLSGKIFILERQIKEVENRKTTLSTQIKVCENRTKLLTEMQASYEGYNYAIRKLLKECENNLGIKNKIVGVLANLIKVPEKYETAIEVALGSAVQNIVTFDENGAKDLISYLKQNKFGRATFLPITTMKARYFDIKQISGRIGVMGLASELISYDSKIANIISNLLGTTVIVDNMQHAITLAGEKGYSFRIVTLEGDILSTQGSFTGGSRKEEAVNLISRDREIKSLKEEIVRQNEELKKCDIDLQKNIELLSQSKALLESCQNNKSQSEVELAKLLESKENLAKEDSGVLYDLEVLEKEQETINNKLKLIDSDLNEKSKLESALSGNTNDADEIIREKRQKNEELRAKREEVVANMTTVKVEIASVTANLESYKQDAERYTSDLENQQGLIKTYESEIEENEKTVLSLESMIKLKLENAPQSEVKNKLEKLKAKRTEIETTKSGVSSSIKNLDEQKTKLMDNLTSLNDRKVKEEAGLERVDIELEQMQERIYEEYSMTYNDCLAYKRANFDIVEGMKDISRLKKDIQALGYVNVHAIEDVKVLYERYSEMSSQSEDLHKAEEDLVKIIKDLSGEMLTKFNESFDAINESFKIVFRELFGGGTARLELTEAEDELEAGVEIIVQLPGKAANKLSLLSGGEKTLTAISLLFAILRLKPLPFSFLDEIEAALDDANIERFAQYLKRLSNTTQFIVITHRKPTMELADNLFGVTMQEKGVSKVVSVKLAEAITQAETQTEG